MEWECIETHTHMRLPALHTLHASRWGRGDTRVRLPPEPEAEKKRSVTLAFIAEGPTRVLSRSCETALG